MNSDQKQRGIPVNIRHPEQAHGIDLHEFKPEVTYPLAKLMDALGFVTPGRPTVKTSNTNTSRIIPKGPGEKIVGRRVDITIMDEPYTGEVLDPAKREKLLKGHRTYLAKIQREEKEKEKATR